MKQTFVTIFAASLFLVPHSGFAQCVTTGQTMTCGGAFAAADLPIRYVNSAGLGLVDRIVLDPTFSGVALDSTGVELLSSTDISTNLSIELNAMATLDRTGNASDAIFIRNTGGGSQFVDVSGTVTGDKRAVRVWTDLPDGTGGTRVEVSRTGVIDSTQTGIWIRNQSIGPVSIGVDGRINTPTVRGIHVSNNNALNTSDVSVDVGFTGRVTAGEQAIYVGTVGSGPIIVSIAGEVQGGIGADLGAFGPTGALQIDATVGTSELMILNTGSVTSLNDRVLWEARTRLPDGESPGDFTATIEGDITGFLESGPGASTFVVEFSSAWNLRNFVDSDDDGVRDLAQPIVNTFGDGIDSLVMRGSVFVLSVADDGLEPVSLLGLESFRHSGLLSMRDFVDGSLEPTAGDTFTISGGDGVGDGGGMYVADGGRLGIDVLFDDGTGTADRLIVDQVSVDSGPVTIEIQVDPDSVAGATGDGASDGIIVIEVVGEQSSAGAFELAEPLYVGDYEYFLRQVGKNWVLQSEEYVAECGNGRLDSDEGCDDGNIESGDGCADNCLIETGQQCNTDDAGLVGNASCQSQLCEENSCVEPQPECGDGTLGEQEGCDDGNSAAGDGCDADCKIENDSACNMAEPGLLGSESCASEICEEGTCVAGAQCGDGTVDEGEACDDNNTEDGDGCDASCRFECGNGNVDDGETCDDGNMESGDGCDAMCQVEPGSPVVVVQGGSGNCAVASPNPLMLLFGFLILTVGRLTRRRSDR